MRLLRLALLPLVVAACGARRGSEAASSTGRERRAPLIPPHVASPAPEGFQRTQEEGLWRLAAVEPDDRVLRVRIATGGCRAADHMEVRQSTPEAITLVAIVDELRPTGEGVACTMALGLNEHRVRLPDAVANRRIEGECHPGDVTPEQRQCASLAAAVDRAR